MRLPSVPHRLTTLFVLILCGEAIFSLPFHLTRYFRPLVLDALSLSNTQLGDAFALYGVVAMLSYFPGGVIADRFPCRTLISVSMFATAAGGLALMTVPSPTELACLYAFWGLTTILLFWAALFKCVRLLGSETQAGRLGLLDGGRGAVSAALASVATLILGVITAGHPSDAASLAGFRAVGGFYMSATALAGICALLLLRGVDALPGPADSTLSPSSGPSSGPSGGVPSNATNFSNMHNGPIRTEREPKPVDAVPASFATLIREHALIWQALVVLSAYTVFKSLDFLSLYLADVHGQSTLQSARTVTLLAWLRPVGAIAAGLVAVRVSPSRVCAALFAVLIVTFGLLAAGSLEAATFPLNATAAIAMLAVGALCTFGLRGIYFALISESGAPRAAAGTAVGLVSAVGFLPEIYLGSGAGRLLDALPGEPGFRVFFACLAINCAIGLWAIFRIRAHHRG